jgi:hypothetical protein
LRKTRAAFAGRSTPLLGVTGVDTDWFRNKTWSEAIESRFKEKLRRARRKEQYLRIQASMLAPTFPDATLRLLDEYFALPDDFDHAQAHVDRATALLVFGRVDEAIGSYESALAREHEFPKLKTEAYIDLPYMIAQRSMRNRYARATELLRVHESRLMFPVDHFRWNAAQALISGDLGNTVAARAYARRALDAAMAENSGFRYHPSVGLVTDQYDGVIRKLEEWSDA